MTTKPDSPADEASDWEKAKQAAQEKCKGGLPERCPWPHCECKVYIYPWRLNDRTN